MSNRGKGSHVLFSKRIEMLPVGLMAGNPYPVYHAASLWGLLTTHFPSLRWSRQSSGRCMVPRRGPEQTGEQVPSFLPPGASGEDPGEREEVTDP